MTSNDETRIDEIRAWFDERGYDLYVHQIEGHGWRAPYVPKGSRIGSAAYGVGKTPLQAAEDARARFDGGRAIFAEDGGVASESASVTIHAPAASARATAPQPHVVIEPEALVHGRAIHEPTVEATPPIDVPDVDAEKLTTYGWRVLFEEEPNGKVTGYLLDLDSGATLKVVTENDFEDAYLSLGIGTMHPSAELRRKRNQRRSNDASL
jgi:hypothetical protein